MENGFLDEMVKRVGAFQRHEHSAWNETISFDERLKGLPLYALEFNNPDRDPNRHGPTIAHYAPARQEMIALVKIISETVKSSIRVLDVGCGNGFVGSLLAREGVPVIGIDNHSWNSPQIPHFYDQQVYQFRVPSSLEEFEDDFNVALCSWMNPSINLTPQILAKCPELIVHIYSVHTQPDGTFQTGCKEAYLCPENYCVLGAWAACTPDNFFASVESRFSSKAAVIRITEVWSRCDIHAAKFFAPKQMSCGYNWDDEREAMNLIRTAQNLDVFQIHEIRPK